MSARPIQITVAMDPDAPAIARTGEPVAIGVSLARGRAMPATRWIVRDDRGQARLAQATTLDRWSDGSVRWLLVEFRADVGVGKSAEYWLEENETVLAPSAPFAHADRERLLSSLSIEAEDINGVRHTFAMSRATIERTGPLTVVDRLDGHLRSAEGRDWLEASLRLHWYAGLGAVRVEISITNPRAAAHPGGAWDLGDAGSVLIRDLSLHFDRAASPDDRVFGSLEIDAPIGECDGQFAVYQDSSGGPNWQHVNHANRDGAVCTTFQGYRALARGAESGGLRATPVVTTGEGASAITITVRNFWQTFPKSLEATSGRISIGILPRHYGDAHELQGGERITTAVVLGLGTDPVCDQSLFWVRSPLRVHADPASYLEAEACAPFRAGSPVAREQLRGFSELAISPADSFVARRETVDEYGWRNFGELWADHESAGGEDRVSHYNNQYDAIAGFAVQFLRSGDARWFALMDDLANHVTDIDLYHTDRDRAAYNGGYFWHTQHYAPAHTSTHRAYARRNGSGGGPSAEHNYSTGLLLHHFLTGSERSRAAVIQLANWVLDMDDGSKSRFRWIDRQATGLASGTRSPDFHGPGRGAGNSINTLLDAHRLTGDARYLEKADGLIARCVHPADDPASIDPLNAEDRWSYTVFLQAIGKYLEHRRERGLADDRYVYARDALMRYARWMAIHERNYLDHPEQLEFPNETWAAQDLRKAAVLEFAARYGADAAERDQLLARATRFVDDAMQALADRPTRRLTRPIVLMLAYAVQRPLSGDEAADVAAQPDRRVELARPPFVPLRARVTRKLLLAGAGLSAAALIAIVLLTF